MQIREEEAVLKKLKSIIITSFVLIGLSYGVSYYTKAHFLDYAFFVGVIVSVVIWFFTSKGGFTSRHLDMSIQANTGIKMEKQNHDFSFSPSIAFLTSVAYTIITLVSSLIFY